MYEMSGAKRFAIGCVGAGVFVGADLLRGALDVASIQDPFFLLGQALRWMFFVMLGGLLAWLYKDVKELYLLFHIGLSAPAILVSLLLPPETITIEKYQRARLASESAAFDSAASIPVAMAQGEQGSEEETSDSTARPGAGSTSFERGVKGERFVPAAEARFRLVFYSVLGLTLFSALANIFLIIVPRSSDEKSSGQMIGAVEAFATTWKLGFGAIIGLVVV